MMRDHVLALLLALTVVLEMQETPQARAGFSACIKQYWVLTLGRLVAISLA